MGDELPRLPPPPFKRERRDYYNREWDQQQQQQQDDDAAQNVSESMRIANIQRLLELVKQKRAQSVLSRKRLRDEVDFEVIRLKRMVDSIGETLNRDLDRIYAEDDLVLEDLETELRSEITLPRFSTTDTLLKRARDITSTEKRYDIYRNDSVSERSDTTERTYIAKYTIESRTIHHPQPTSTLTPTTVNPNNTFNTNNIINNNNLNSNSINNNNTINNNNINNGNNTMLKSDVNDQYGESKQVDVERPKAYMFKLLAECSGAIPTEPVEKVLARLKAKGAEWAAQCAWRECPSAVSYPRRYSVSGLDRRVATMVRACRTTRDMSTVLGDTPLPRDAICEWSVQVLRTRKGSGCCILVGVSMANADQDAERNFERSGWYLYCYDSNLSSGPPHRLCRKPYGPRKQVGTYVKEGDSVGVVFDTRSSVSGTLSFVLGGVNRGIAAEGIPLDVPLVPAAILFISEDSVQFIPGGKRDSRVLSSQPPPLQKTQATKLPSLLSLGAIQPNNNNNFNAVSNNSNGLSTIISPASQNIQDYKKNNIDYLLN